jgi:hypothetical protein
MPMTEDLAGECVALLRENGVSLAEGLSSQELAEIERRFDFAFGEDHAALLRLAIPVGTGWPDWRGPDENLREHLAEPVEGLIFDVELNGFWPRSWGPRPDIEAQAISEARRQLRRWPKLVPVFGHRYTPAAPSPSGAPVFSVHQTDVIYYGTDLHDYLQREFGRNDRTPVEAVAHPIESWSSLAMGLEDKDL